MAAVEDKNIAQDSAREAEANEATTVRAGFEITVGSERDWIGAGTTFAGGVEIDLMEWNSSLGSVALTREQTLELIEKLQTLVK